MCRLIYFSGNTKKYIISKLFNRRLDNHSCAHTRFFFIFFSKVITHSLVSLVGAAGN